jgi:LysR family transcriptional regulator, glycine cleavage system transcriptional activator
VAHRRCTGPLEEDGLQPSSSILSWRHWLTQKGHESLEPRRWVYLNYTHQQVQAALAGQGIAMARLALVHTHLERGELVEPFGTQGRLATNTAYWLLPTLSARLRPELRDAMHWIREQALRTRLAMGESGTPETVD